MPHSVRQEQKITLAGRTFIMRPTFIGMDKLEEHLGMSVFLFTNSVAQTGNMKLRDLAMCIHCGIVGDLGDRTPEMEELGELIVEEGPMKVVPILIEFLMTSMLDESQAIEIQNRLAEQDKSGKKPITAKRSGKKKAGKKK